MLRPDEVKEMAAKREDQNWDFRAFLKGHADEDELDAQFLALHNELFASYDCCECNNCCKSYEVLLNGADIQRISAHLNMTADAFGNAYLEACENDDDGNEQYVLKADSCVFLQEDGRCRIHSCKPDSCKGYPFTDRPERLFSLISVVEFAKTCPVVFEILERLKAQYRFRSPSPSARR
jgi:Fe-S-cluster containining protein